MRSTTFLAGGLGLAILLLASVGAAQGKQTREAPKLAIATWDESAQSVRLLKDRLAKTFEEGTPIEEVKIEKQKGRYYLVRKGMDKAGNCIVDSTELGASPDGTLMPLLNNNGGRGGSNRCRGFLCKKCKPYHPVNGCDCEKGFYCNHEIRVSSDLFAPGLLPQ